MVLVLNQCVLRQTTGGGPIEFARTDAVNGDANYASSYTFNNVAIGAATSDRVVIVHLYADYLAGTATATFNGGAADYETVISTSGAYLGYKKITSGTTFDLGIVGQTDNAHIEVMTVTGTTGAHTAVTTSFPNADDASVTIDVPANGITVAGASCYQYDHTVATWTNATKQGTDFSQSSGPGVKMSFATTIVPGSSTAINYRIYNEGESQRPFALWALSFAK
jgi:hypothetical protein